jgi:hypothetical protein
MYFRFLIYFPYILCSIYLSSNAVLYFPCADVSLISVYNFIFIFSDLFFITCWLPIGHMLIPCWLCCCSCLISSGHYLFYEDITHKTYELMWAHVIRATVYLREQTVPLKLEQQNPDLKDLLFLLHIPLSFFQLRASFLYSFCLNITFILFPIYFL